MPTTHLAIFTQPLLDLLLEGHKTIETRMSKIKIPPYKSIAVGDHVIMKQSGGPVKGAFEVAKVDTFHSESCLDRQLYESFCDADGLNIFGQRDVMNIYRDVFRKKWCASKYATFMHVKNVQCCDPVIPIKKTNRQAWVVLGDGTAQEWLFNLEQTGRL